MGKLEKTGAEAIDEMVGGYRASQVVLTANRLGVFQALADGELSMDDMAAVLEADPRGLRILCDALVGLSLLEKQRQSYGNSPLTQEFLLLGKPQSKVAQVHHAAKLYERWGTLFDVVKTGQPADEEAIDPRLIGDKRQFAEAMADTARTVADRTAVLLDLSKCKRVLDLGGGPGLYCIAFARRYPQLEAVILDDEQTTPVAHENIERAGLAQRISTIVGDAFHDDLGKDYDFIFVSNLVHIYSAEENGKLISKCARALVSGGTLCLKDFFLDSDRTSPSWAALFAVNMLVNTEQGDCYTLEEVCGWFNSAQLKFSEVLELTPQSKLVLGRKP